MKSRESQVTIVEARSGYAVTLDGRLRFVKPGERRLSNDPLVTARPDAWAMPVLESNLAAPPELPRVCSGCGVRLGEIPDDPDDGSRDLARYTMFPGLRVIDGAGSRVTGYLCRGCARTWRGPGWLATPEPVIHARPDAKPRRPSRGPIVVGDLVEVPPTEVRVDVVDGEMRLVAVGPDGQVQRLVAFPDGAGGFRLRPAPLDEDDGEKAERTAEPAEAEASEPALVGEERR